MNRKREVSECDNDEKDGRNEQGGAPVKRQRSEVSETQTSSTTKSAHKVRDLEVTEVKEAELVNFKPVCTEWQQEMCGRFNLTLKGAPSIPETYLLSSVAWGLNLRVG